MLVTSVDFLFLKLIINYKLQSCLLVFNLLRNLGEDRGIIKFRVIIILALNAEPNNFRSLHFAFKTGIEVDNRFRVKLLHLVIS